jgi:hypothetical protein
MASGRMAGEGSKQFGDQPVDVPPMAAAVRRCGLACQARLHLTPNRFHRSAWIQNLGLASGATPYRRSRRVDPGKSNCRPKAYVCYGITTRGEKGLHAARRYPSI